MTMKACSDTGTKARSRGRDADARGTNLRACVPLCRRAFTLIEVLVVIVVMGVLIAAIGLVGSRVMNSHKIRITEATMKATRQAIDQFATQNPLGTIYKRRNAETFGTYPPYQLANRGSGVAWVLEPNHPLCPPSGLPQTLANRVARDLSGQTAPVLNQWVGFVDDPNTDDIRALYTYLKVYAASELSQVPNTAVKPLSPTGEYVNPAGKGSDPNSALGVQGIYDAWGVPLMYFLYVKVEYGVLPNGTVDWRVTDRKPVLASRGISFEEYVEELKGTDPLDPEKWIVSEPFPAPAAVLDDAQTGKLNASTKSGGWVRMKAAGHEKDYTYVP